MTDDENSPNIYLEILNEVLETKDLSPLTDILPALFPQEREELMRYIFWNCLKTHLFSVAEDLIKNGFELDPVETWKSGSLCDAMEMAGDDVVIATWLLDHGADIERRDCEYGAETPLMCAVGRQYLAITKLLLERGANPNATTQIDNYDSPLIIAATVQSKEAVQLLIEFGAEQSYRNRWGLTALDVARKSADLSFIKLFRGPERSGLV